MIVIEFKWSFVIVSLTYWLGKKKKQPSNEFGHVFFLSVWPVLACLQLTIMWMFYGYFVSVKCVVKKYKKRCHISLGSGTDLETSDFKEASIPVCKSRLWTNGKRNLEFKNTKKNISDGICASKRVLTNT